MVNKYPGKTRKIVKKKIYRYTQKGGGGGRKRNREANESDETLTQLKEAYEKAKEEFNALKIQPRTGALTMRYNISDENNKKHREAYGKVLIAEQDLAKYKKGRGAPQNKNSTIKLCPKDIFRKNPHPELLIQLDKNAYSDAIHDDLINGDELSFVSPGLPDGLQPNSSNEDELINGVYENLTVLLRTGLDQDQITKENEDFNIYIEKMGGEGEHDSFISIGNFKRFIQSKLGGRSFALIYDAAKLSIDKMIDASKKEAEEPRAAAGGGAGGAGRMAEEEPRAAAGGGAGGGGPALRQEIQTNTLYFLKLSEEVYDPATKFNITDPKRFGKFGNDYIQALVQTSKEPIFYNPFSDSQQAEDSFYTKFQIKMSPIEYGSDHGIQHVSATFSHNNKFLYSATEESSDKQTVKELIGSAAGEKKAAIIQSKRLGDQGQSLSGLRLSERKLCKYDTWNQQITQEQVNPCFGIVITGDRPLLAFNLLYQMPILYVYSFANSRYCAFFLPKALTGQTSIYYSQDDFLQKANSQLNHKLFGTRLKAYTKKREELEKDYEELEEIINQMFRLYDFLSKYPSSQGDIEGALTYLDSFDARGGGASAGGGAGAAAEGRILKYEEDQKKSFDNLKVVYNYYLSLESVDVYEPVDYLAEIRSFLEPIHRGRDQRVNPLIANSGTEVFRKFVSIRNYKDFERTFGRTFSFLSSAQGQPNIKLLRDFITKINEDVTAVSKGAAAALPIEPGFSKKQRGKFIRKKKAEALGRKEKRSAKQAGKSVLTGVKNRLKKGRKEHPTIENVKGFVKTHFKKEIEGETNTTEPINKKAQRKKGFRGGRRGAAQPAGAVGGGLPALASMGRRKQSGGASSAAAGGGAAAAADEQQIKDDPSYDLKQLFFYNIPTDKEISASSQHIQYVPNHPINILYLLYLSVEMAFEEDPLFDIYDKRTLETLRAFMKNIFNKFKNEYDDKSYTQKGPYKSKYYTSFAMGKYVYRFIRKLYAYSFEETIVDLSLLFSLLEYYFGCHMSTLELEGNYNDFAEITELITPAAHQIELDDFVDDLQSDMVCEWITRYILKEDFDITETVEEEFIQTEEPHSLIAPIEEGGLVNLLKGIKEQTQDVPLKAALDLAIIAAKKEQIQKQKEKLQEEVDDAKKAVDDAEQEDKPSAAAALAAAEAALAAAQAAYMDEEEGAGAADLAQENMETTSSEMTAQGGAAGPGARAVSMLEEEGGAGGQSAAHSVISGETASTVEEKERELSQLIGGDIDEFFNQYEQSYRSPDRHSRGEGAGGSSGGRGQFSVAETASVGANPESQAYGSGGSPEGSQTTGVPGSPPRKLKPYELIEKILEQKTGTNSNRLKELKDSIKRIKQAAEGGAGGAGGAGGGGAGEIMAEEGKRKTRRKRSGLSNKSRRYRFF